MIWMLNIGYLQIVNVCFQKVKIFEGEFKAKI